MGTAAALPRSAYALGRAAVPAAPWAGPKPTFGGKAVLFAGGRGIWEDSQGALPQYKAASSRFGIRRMTSYAGIPLALSCGPGGREGNIHVARMDWRLASPSVTVDHIERSSRGHRVPSAEKT